MQHASPNVLKQIKLASKSENKQLGEAIEMFPLSLLSLPAASQRAAAHLWGKLGKTDEEGVKTQGGERQGKRDSLWVNFHL